MGRTASSKHKSSNKKKSKLSSQTRRKRTSKRNKSKRVYSDDSVSSYSDESLSVSSSDSEDGFVGRKGRSRVRDKVKSSKKRARRSSSCDDSSVDVKVRKRSKKIGDSKVRKKTHKKKKRNIRRKVSVSSSSSDSGILRTRRHDSSSGTEESEHERKRGRSRKRKSDKTSSGRIGSKKSKLRSRSCSSCSRHSDNSDDIINNNVVSEIDQNREIVTSEILPRRLKSVITVVRPHEEEVTGQDKDENKEEIFYDQDDYPSCRSNDSNDGGKRDLAHKSYDESEKERAEDMVGEEDFSSEIVAKESRLSSGDRIDQSDRASITYPGNKNKIDTSTATAGSGSEDLETILRQKALENLMRFRGPQRNAKPMSHHESESERNVNLSTAKSDDVQNKSSKQELSIGVGETGGRNQQNRRTMRTNSSRFVQTEEMKLDRRDIGIELSTAKQRVVHPSAGVEISGKSSNTSPLMEQPPGSSLEKLPQSPVSAHVQGTSPTSMNVVIHKSAAEKAETVAGSIGNNENAGVNDACHVVPESSCTKPISEEHNSKQCQDESKGNSFEQKTMSVMRGGEMVQVSYKVYIPNKAPALARRKLQR